MHNKNLVQISRLTVMALLALSVAACAADDPAVETTASDDMTEMTDMSEEGHDEYAFGEPADAADADRVIEITADDSFAFEPAEVVVTAGEVVTFRVTNIGAIPHDFTLGDEALQDEHEAEMTEMGGQMDMHEEPNAMSVGPGETTEMTWHFTEPTELIFGCHQAGHYAAGMKGVLTIES